MSESSFAHTGLKGLSGEKGDVMWHCVRCLWESAEGSRFFSLFIVIFFLPVVFRGKFKEVVQREVALLGSLLNSS